MTDSNVSERSKRVLQALIKRYIQAGSPVASSTVRQEAGLPVSAATVRNIMSDLEHRGYLHAPHTSAGRVPTAAGYRLYIDTLLQVDMPDAATFQALKNELVPDKSARDLVQTTSGLLADITAQAGLVTVPKPESQRFRQVEFLPLSGNRVLVILVINQHEVQNKIIQTHEPFDAEQLKAAATLINEQFSGCTFEEIDVRLKHELQEARSRIDRLMEDNLTFANKALLPSVGSDDDYCMAGESRLLDAASPEELMHLKTLFGALERKKEVLHLLEQSSSAQGVKIFIGQEAGLSVLGNFSLITAPYGDGKKTLGVLGVIGPTRMEYNRVIPVVDLTARMLTQALSN
jgi:heat-inducible transcriptional repressor